jgi:hypothetical protein
LGFSEGLFPPLTEAQARQARKAIADFKANPKGPWIRIRWYCKDGSILPPAGTPCAALGGGIQHAEASPAARELARWNLDTGTILAGLPFEEWFDAKRDHHRLKEIVLEKYLVAADNGWIYRRASSYRGARQAEDEQKAGRLLLTELLSDPKWTARNYFLANQLVGAVPRGASGGMVRKIRTLSAAIADRDRRFQAIRSKIHSSPGPEDLDAVEKFLAARGADEEERARLTELIALLREQREMRELTAALDAMGKKFDVAALAAAMRSGSDEAIFGAAAALSFAIHRQVTVSPDGRRNLELLDLNALVAERAFLAARAVPNPSRRRLLQNLLDEFRLAVGGGLLSLRQFAALEAEIAAAVKSQEMSSAAWQASARYLARAAEWCRATAARDFGPVANHFQTVEPAAKGFLDHLLRSSAALPLSARLETLAADANRAAGIRHAILGGEPAGGVIALNPGVALGRLGIVESEDDAIDPRGIYVIPETVSGLKPMAGILTLDSGNALSHAQLLAANLGIPNAAVPSSLLAALRQRKGQELFYAVTPRGVVILREKASLGEGERKLFASAPAANKPRIDLDTSRVNLEEKRLRNLTELGTRDSGVSAGPKAANLGQLASYFPDKVAPGIVIPFGVYYEHIHAVLDDGVPLDKSISEAFARADRLRETGAEPAEVRKFIYPELERFRKLIRTLTLRPEFETLLKSRMAAEFGPDGTYGVFVRSDTNAEDLPEFTGAGLNLTVPNQVGYQNIAQAVKDVWASPFTERAYDWRSRILRGHDRVYPSVILLRTVASDMSGVVGTINLETGDTAEITVNVSEGVSAVVDGGVAESLLLKPDGGVRLLQQFRAAYRKFALPTGGFENRPASGAETLLGDQEIAQIRRMVEEVKAKYPPAKTESGDALPWDIEFGFEKGQLRLFQIRPLVRYQEWKTLDALAGLEERTGGSETVRLDGHP